MKLLVIRHAIAEDRDAWAETGKDDARRPLTARGRKRMRQNARGLRAVQPEIDTIGTSPLTRARQTARIVGRVFKEKPTTVDALVPDGDREQVLEWLLEQPEQDTVAIVGHEPSLGLLASWLLAAPLSHFIEFRKGGVALISWEGPPEPGNGWLEWSLQPKHLRRLAV